MASSWSWKASRMRRTARQPKRTRCAVLDERVVNTGHRTGGRASGGRREPRRDAYDRERGSDDPGSAGCVVGAIVAGGAVLAWHISDRQRTRSRRSRSPSSRPAWPPCCPSCAPPRCVDAESDHVLKASAPAYAFGLVRGNKVLVRRAARPDRPGTPRRPDPRERHRPVRRTAAGSTRTADGPRGPAGLAPGAGPRRGPHPRAPGRGGAPRLRGQRQPRAQDPGRRHPAAGRGRHRRRRRPRGRAALRQPDAAPRATASPSWSSRSSSCPGSRATTRSRRPVLVRPRRTRWRPRSTRSAMEAAAKEITVESRGEHGLQVFGSQEQIGAAISNLVANAVAYSNERLAGRGDHPLRGRHRCRSRWSTRASASRPRTSTASSSASTASTRPGTARPAAPVSGCPSSSTSPPPTAATSRCGRSRARARRSPSPSPSHSEPVAARRPHHSRPVEVVAPPHAVPPVPTRPRDQQETP